MSELDRGRKHNNSEEQIPKVFIMFVIIALYSNTPCMDISFLRRKKRLQEIRRYLLKRKTSDPMCSHFTFSIDLL